MILEKNGAISWQTRYFLRCYDWERKDCEGSYLESNCEVLFHVEESYWNFLQESRQLEIGSGRFWQSGPKFC